MEKESLRAKLRMESDLFDKVLEKLVIHGGGAVDFDENAVRGITAGATPTPPSRSAEKRNSIWPSSMPCPPSAA